MKADAARGTERPAQRRLKNLTELSRVIRDVPEHLLLADLPDSVAPILKATRFRKRLEAGTLKASGVMRDPDVVSEPPVRDILGLSGAELRALICDTGVCCQFAALRKVLDQAELRRLSDALDVDLLDHAARSTVRTEEMKLTRFVLSASPADNDDGLQEAILRDGLACWVSWISRQHASARAFLMLLTPPDLLDRMPHRPGARQSEDGRARSALFGLRLAAISRNEKESAPDE